MFVGGGDRAYERSPAGRAKPCGHRGGPPLRVFYLRTSRPAGRGHRSAAVDTAAWTVARSPDHAGSTCGGKRSWSPCGRRGWTLGVHSETLRLSEVDTARLPRRGGGRCGRPLRPAGRAGCGQPWTLWPASCGQRCGHPHGAVVQESHSAALDVDAERRCGPGWQVWRQ
jgi:hypothetical protein